MSGIASASAPGGMEQQQQQEQVAANTAQTLVCVRLRPASSKETGVRCVSSEGPNNVNFQNIDRAISAYCYDKVYGEDVTQTTVFEDCKHIISSVINGYNGTIMAYGQTGSGKTHTLIGSLNDPSLRGLVPRAVQALGEGIAADTTGAEFEVRLSVVEIYCERIRDLLDPSRDNLQVKQDATGAIYIEGALEAQVGSEDQLVDVMHNGLAARTVSATSMNAESSRSHCIVTVTVEKTCPDGSVMVGKLKMVDLAGSERQDKTHAAGQTLVEGSQINRSLSALANVIYALTDTASSADSVGECGGKHVPYRDSKLTRVLQDSLGGTSRTMLIICCSPCMENGSETLSSLRFGCRARGIKNKVTVNTRLSADMLQQQLVKANAKIKEMEEQLLQEQKRTAPALALSGSNLRQPYSICNSSSVCNNAAGCNIRNESTDCKTVMEHVIDSNHCSSKANISTKIDSLLHRVFSKRVPWWQHVLLSGFSMATVAAYMSFETRFYGKGCPAVAVD